MNLANYQVERNNCIIILNSPYFSRRTPVDSLSHVAGETMRTADRKQWKGTDLGDYWVTVA